ncbi:hypothetical protein LLG46_03485 [bacterium]|nr:hypothetical protein [bacterium]
MSIHLYRNTDLTDQISEGTMANPDSDIYNGSDGESKDRELFIANEQTALATAMNSSQIDVQLSYPRFINDEAIIIGSEQMRILSGGGTTNLTVERGYGGTTPTSHSSGTKVYSGYDYTGLVVQVLDTTDSDESSWCRLAATQTDLDSATPGAQLILGDKAHAAKLSFWRRIAVPAGTPVQNKIDIKLKILGTEYPIL